MFPIYGQGATTDPGLTYPVLVPPVPPEDDSCPFVTDPLLQWSPVFETVRLKVWDPPALMVALSVAVPVSFRVAPRAATGPHGFMVAAVTLPGCAVIVHVPDVEMVLTVPLKLVLDPPGYVTEALVQFEVAQVRVDFGEFVHVLMVQMATGVQAPTLAVYPLAHEVIE